MDTKMKKKIVVTGGSGLIGMEVCRQLQARGYEVYLFDLGEQIERVRRYIPEGVRIIYGSILDMSSLRDTFVDCEIVIHLAALLGVHRSENQKLRCLEINIDGTKNVFECAVQRRVKKVVFASSSEIYGEPHENPITEETMPQAKSVYAITKLAGEELCKAYAQTYSIDYTILRYFNCYGPYQTAQFVIPRFMHNIINGQPPVIYGDGKQIRSYTYVSDTARATILAALSDKANSQILNVGNGEKPISLVDLCDLAIKIAGKENSVSPKLLNDFEGTDRKKEREIYERYCDAGKLKNLLDWRPEISLEEGIRKTLEKGVTFVNWMNYYDDFGH